MSIFKNVINLYMYMGGIVTPLNYVLNIDRHNVKKPESTAIGRGLEVLMTIDWSELYYRCIYDLVLVIIDWSGYTHI